MANTLALSGNDTLTLNNRVMADFATGNVIELTFPNEIASVKTGKDGNSIFGFNASGVQAELKIEVVRGGSDDKWLNNLLIQQNSNFAGTVLLQGQFIKKIGDGSGNVTSDTYILAAGIFVKAVEGKTNVEGDADQSMSHYVIRFASAVRVLT